MTITASAAQAIAKKAKENQTPQEIWDAIEKAAKEGSYCCDCWVDEAKVSAITIDLVQHDFSSVVFFNKENLKGLCNIVIYWKEPKNEAKK